MGAEGGLANIGSLAKSQVATCLDASLRCAEGGRVAARANVHYECMCCYGPRYGHESIFRSMHLCVQT